MSSKHMCAIAVVALLGLGAASTAQTKPLLQSAPKKTATAPAAKTPAKTTASKTPNTTTPKTTTAPATTPAQAPSDAASLESVLDQLDKASADFKSTEADFVWEQYQKVVDETDTQKGRIFFLRRDKDTTNMAANVVEPDKKDLVYAEGKLRFYQPRIDQLTEYDAGKNKGEVEAFLVLGFGGRGHDLAKSFTVKFAGFETIEGVRTAKLELDPKAPKVKNNFEKIILWVDPARGVSLRQQFIEPSGDYRLAHYTNFKMNGKLGDDVFKIKTTPKTKTVKQQ
ncbi:MAG: outer membrane lipoprotein carrier protein LolA [Terriglobales bacterium]